MMNDTSLKAKIRNIANDKNVTAQSVLQNYLLNHFLLRLSMSEYKDKFIVKGGILISSIIGIDQRTTMDLDTTIRKLTLSKEAIEKAFIDICSIKADDDLLFVLNGIKPIRDDDEYGGYRISFSAIYGKLNVPMSMDVSTGDVITPDAKLHTFYDLLNRDLSFELYSYTLETVLAEKIETILSRGIDNTRTRDFYDIYKLSSLDYDYKLLKEAFINTAKHRNSFEKISNSTSSIVDTIMTDKEMEKRWNNYSKQMFYANDINFKDTIDVLRNILINISLN